MLCRSVLWWIYLNNCLYNIYKHSPAVHSLCDFVALDRPPKFSTIRVASLHPEWAPCVLRPKCSMMSFPVVCCPRSVVPLLPEYPDYPDYNVSYILLCAMYRFERSACSSLDNQMLMRLLVFPEAMSAWFCLLVLVVPLLPARRHLIYMWCVWKTLFASCWAGFSSLFTLQTDDRGGRKKTRGSGGWVRAKHREQRAEKTWEIANDPPDPDPDLVLALNCLPKLKKCHYTTPIWNYRASYNR